MKTLDRDEIKLLIKRIKKEKNIRIKKLSEVVIIRHRTLQEKLNLLEDLHKEAKSNMKDPNYVEDGLVNI